MPCCSFNNALFGHFQHVDFALHTPTTVPGHDQVLFSASKMQALGSWAVGFRRGRRRGPRVATFTQVFLQRARPRRRKDARTEPRQRAQWLKLQGWAASVTEHSSGQIHVALPLMAAFQSCPLAMKAGLLLPALASLT